jgi:hypothetical protein
VSTVSFHPWTPEALASIADRMRAEDVAELAVTSPDRSPQDVLMDSAKDSRWCIVAEFDGRPTVAYGVGDAAHDANLGVPWMLSTDDLPRMWRALVAHGPRELRLMQQRYTALANAVHARNATAIRYLEWLGFTVDRGQRIGPGGQLHPFWKGAIRNV